MPKYSLDDVTIHGFRGLRNLRLDGLGWINILVGANNSGKTSVLEALSILCNPIEPLEWLSMVHRRDFGGLDETRIQSLRWCFRQTGELVNPDAIFEAECRLTNIGTFPLWMNIITLTVGTKTNRTVAKRLKQSIHGLDADQILLSDFFGLKTTIAPAKRRQLDEITDRIRSGDRNAPLQLIREMGSGTEEE